MKEKIKISTQRTQSTRRRKAKMPGSRPSRDRRRPALHFIDNAAGDAGGDGRAFEGAAVEGRVTGLAGGVLDVIGPGMIGGKNRKVGGMIGGDFPLAFDAKDAGRAGGEEFDHAHEREAVGVDELLERESESGFEAEDAERCAVELDIFER